MGPPTPPSPWPRKPAGLGAPGWTPAPWALDRAAAWVACRDRSLASWARRVKCRGRGPSKLLSRTSSSLSLGRRTTTTPSTSSLPSNASSSARWPRIRFPLALASASAAAWAAASALAWAARAIAALSSTSWSSPGPESLLPRSLRVSSLGRGSSASSAPESLLPPRSRCLRRDAPATAAKVPDSRLALRSTSTSRRSGAHNAGPGLVVVASPGPEPPPGAEPVPLPWVPLLAMESLPALEAGPPEPAAVPGRDLASAAAA
mmetsp:Transcript_67215/g.151980  ORF Transcript_67215/g.151980 Transcript_67215/m.151980 type:complete len:261 (-) Transcript_67215:1844-2626(-)